MPDVAEVAEFPAANTERLNGLLKPADASLVGVQNLDTIRILEKQNSAAASLPGAFLSEMILDSSYPADVLELLDNRRFFGAEIFAE
jgi:hypothetical protein